MSDRGRALVLGASATVMAIFGVAGHSRLSGPVLIVLTAHHGVHRDDVVVVIGWAAVMLVSWQLWRR